VRGSPPRARPSHEIDAEIEDIRRARRAGDGARRLGKGAAAGAGCAMMKFLKVVYEGLLRCNPSSEGPIFRASAEVILQLVEKDPVDPGLAGLARSATRLKKRVCNYWTGVVSLTEFVSQPVSVSHNRPRPSPPLINHRVKIVQPAYPCRSPCSSTHGAWDDVELGPALCAIAVRQPGLPVGATRCDPSSGPQTFRQKGWPHEIASAPFLQNVV